MNAILATIATLSEQPAHAAEAGGSSLLTPNAGLMFWTLLIFIALMVILTRYAFGPITAAVEAREKALEDAIVAAKRDREEAAAMLEKQRKQIEAARNDAQRLIADGRAAGEKIRAEMVEETRAQQQELIERARRDIGAEKTRAIRELRAEAVDLAIAGASRVIDENLDDKKNRELVESFLSTLDRKNS